MDDFRVGMCFCGSFCTFDRALLSMEEMVGAGWEVTPIFSYQASRQDTRFGSAQSFLKRAQDISGKKPMTTIQEVEPIGPKKLLDALVILPCTGNTLGKLAWGIVDTPVVMAAKSILRGEKPVVLGISTNDGLGSSAKNIGTLLERKNIYFVPFLQDNPKDKPRSLVCNYSAVIETVEHAVIGRQIQPILG